MDVNTQKVGQFFKSLNEVEFIYVGHIYGIAKQIHYVIKEHSLSKESFCKSMCIKESQYDNFTLGNYNYSLMDIARLEQLINDLREKISITKVGSETI